jgi:DNA-3-methyladenine glycosylase I
VTGVVTGEDGLARCPWAVGHPVNRAYHDSEWGLPIHGESAWLERLTLEAFQSGLSWLTILNKRDAFREVFAGFDADTVAAYGADDVARLLGDARIVRNRRKVEAAVANARATVALRDDGGLEALVLAHAPGDRAAPGTTEELPASTPQSVALSRDLKRRGFAHVGPTTMYALMQATGLVDDHLVGCHRRGAGRRRD